MRYIKVAVFAIAAVLLAGFFAAPAQAEVSFNLAYSNLSQHGSWLVSAQYGHVWQPREYNRDWNPYYDGHWVYTNMGWAWVSDYQWGAIPYHYGTWITDPNIGWVWIPGRVWAPSWVVFRTGPDYIGWAPVPPGFSVGMSIDMGGPSSFVYVSSRNFLAPSLRASIVPRERTSLFINNTTVVNNIVVQNNVVVNNGPDYRVVERATGRTIRQEPIENVARVAPFEHVSRAQLAVDPERVKRGVRVAEPVPASEPLPVSDKGGNRGENTSAADAPRPSNGRPSARPNAQEPGTPPAAVMPTGAAETSQKAPSDQTPPQKQKAMAEQGAKDQENAKATADQGARDQANAKATADQGAKDQANAKAKADQGARDQANAKAKADQGARDQANTKAKADQSARDQANAKAKADQGAPDQANAKAKADQSARDHANAKAQADQSAKDQVNAKAKADQSARDQANAKAQADQSAKTQANAKAQADQSAKAQANAKAKADQSAKDQANAKAKADAKAKKAKQQNPEPAKKDQGSGKDTTPGTTEETPR